MRNLSVPPSNEKRIVEALEKHNELMREQLDLLKEIRYELNQIRGNM